MASLSFQTMSFSPSVLMIGFPYSYLSQKKKFSAKSVRKVPKEDDLQNYEQSTKRDNYNLNRRNLLIGAGGLYGATSTFSSSSDSLAKPVEVDITNCGLTNYPRGGPTGLDCCPPTPENITNFKPEKHQFLKVRCAAHLVDEKYIEKYSKAVALMRNLPQDDPRNFLQQANVHCAYCDASYHQVGFPNNPFDVHLDWLFLPWHRCYLYFFEKILGKLIDDPTFALPFWNWDHPSGMYMPTLYANPNSSLYDPLRDPSHQPPTLMDLSYDGQDVNDGITPEDLIKANLMVVYRTMVSNAKNAIMFFGPIYRAGDTDPPGGASIVVGPHANIHTWVGDPRQQPYRMDMGTFFASGRDPIFFAHHGNVDRLWAIWKTLGGKRKDFTDPDWLNVSFVFYDENAKPVRIKVQDVLDHKKLGYVYQEVDLPWIKVHPRPSNTPRNSKLNESTIPTITFPKKLDTVLRTKIKRPRMLRSTQEKILEEEVLVIKLELVKMENFYKFDVFINEDEENPTRQSRINAEYAGSFAMIPMGSSSTDNNHTMMNQTFTLGLTDLIEELGIDDHDSLEVSLIPKAGFNSIKIMSIKIEFMS